MRKITLLFCLLSAVPAFSQKILKKDIVGKWHFYRQISKGELVMDATDVNVLKKKVIKSMKESNPKFTKDDSVKQIEHALRFFDAVQKMYTVITADGKVELQKADGNFTKGTYTFDEATGTAIVRFENNNYDEKWKLKLEKGILYKEADISPGSVFLYRK